MQETRQHILDILREAGQSTVDTLVVELNARRGSITPVTVRHHLSRLQEEGYVCTLTSKNRVTPGRPQHIYTLTIQGEGIFPNNYKTLASELLKQLSTTFAKSQVNVILEGVADSMADGFVAPDGSLEERLDATVDYLNAHGYAAHWENTSEGIVLRTANCPYHALNVDKMLCSMDMRLIANMLGVVPRLLSQISQGADNCSYLIPKNE